MANRHRPRRRGGGLARGANQPAWQKNALFVVGIVGLGYETVIQHIDRPYLLGVFGSLLGLPLFTGRDAGSQSDDDEDDD